MRLIDTHCHLDFFSQDEQMRIWNQANAAGVRCAIIPAITQGNWREVTRTCTQFSLYAAYGLHPCYVDQHEPTDIEQLDKQLQQSCCVAVGECGLDYVADASRVAQQFYFEAQIELAHYHDLALIVHARAALENVLQTLRHMPEVRFVIHAFSGSDVQLTRLLDMGGYIGVGGTCTYPRAQRLRRQLAWVANDRYILETDSPYQPLYGFQGQQNTPAQLRGIATTLAMLRNTDSATIAGESTKNAENLFKKRLIV